MTNTAWIIFPSSVNLEMVRSALTPLGDAVSYYDPTLPITLRIKGLGPAFNNDRLLVEDDPATIDEINEDMPGYVESRITNPTYFVLFYHGRDRAEEILSILARSPLAQGSMIISPSGDRFYEPGEYLALPEKW